MDIEIFKNPILIWFFVGAFIFLLEFAAPGLILFFFGIGAWVVALLLIVWKVSINVQLVVFLITSILSLILFRKMLKEAFHGHVKGKQALEDDYSDFIGQKAEVSEKIVHNKSGTVEFKGVVWKAVADEAIPAGTRVEIISKDNLTLKVKPLA